jgi:hypothetical protein
MRNGRWATGAGVLAIVVAVAAFKDPRAARTLLLTGFPGAYGQILDTMGGDRDARQIVGSGLAPQRWERTRRRMPETTMRARVCSLRFQDARRGPILFETPGNPS